MRIVDEIGAAYTGLQGIIRKSMGRGYFVTVTTPMEDCDPILIDCYGDVGIAEGFLIESGKYCYHCYHLLLLDKDSRGEIIRPTSTKTGYVPWSETRGPDHVVLYLVQILAPSYESDEHEHQKSATPSLEVYVPLGGQSRLNDENEIITLGRKDRHVKWRAVKPGHAHQIRNYQAPALNLLFMSPAPKGRVDRNLTSRLNPW